MDSLEEVITIALKRKKSSITALAKALGVSRTTFYKRISEKERDEEFFIKLSNEIGIDLTDVSTSDQPSNYKYPEYKPPVRSLAEGNNEILKDKLIENLLDQVKDLKDQINKLKDNT